MNYRGLALLIYLRNLQKIQLLTEKTAKRNVNRLQQVMLSTDCSMEEKKRKTARINSIGTAEEIITATTTAGMLTAASTTTTK